jgi:hypothetical protein
VVIVPDVILDPVSTVDWEAAPIPDTCLADMGDRVRTLVPRFDEYLVSLIEKVADTEPIRDAAVKYGIDKHGVHAILLFSWVQLGWECGLAVTEIMLKFPNLPFVQDTPTNIWLSGLVGVCQS